MRLNKKKGMRQLRESKKRLKTRKSLFWCDLLVWVSFGLMILVKFCTIFLFVQVHEESGAEIEAIATAYEANPIMKIIFNLDKIKFILVSMILPAAGMAVYYYVRRRVLNGKVDIDTLEFFVMFTFFALVINVCNDGAALLSKLIQVI
jgi:hypothetical protein